MINASDRGSRCEEHKCCGVVLGEEDLIICLRKERIQIPGMFSLEMGPPPQAAGTTNPQRQIGTRMDLRVCIYTIGISTTYCNKSKNYPPKRCVPTATIILTLCSKSMHRWNPPYAGLHSESLWTGMLRGATSPFLIKILHTYTKSTSEHVKCVLTC